MQHDFILLDRSGSMGDIWAKALESINGYATELANSGTDTGITLAAFDAHRGQMDYLVLRDRIVPSSWHLKPLSADECSPRGMTPLNDAIGRMVATARAGGYDKVAIIIMTDGMENASKEVSGDRARALLDECRAKGWQVVFLGAAYDPTAQARGLGVDQAWAVAASAATLGMATRSMAAKRHAYATGHAATMDFSDEEREKLKGS